MTKKAGNAFKLLIVIVKKNLSREVVQGCKDGGAEGATVIQGRGSGTHETGSILGVKIEPEKAIVLCLTQNEKLDDVIAEVNKQAKLDKPGTGIAFVLNSNSICGVAHLLDHDFNKNQ